MPIVEWSPIYRANATPGAADLLIFLRYPFLLAASPRPAAVQLETVVLEWSIASTYPLSVPFPIPLVVSTPSQHSPLAAVMTEAKVNAEVQPHFKAM